ncbi:MAG: hypothetical protein A3A58_00045 [Candidatus Blackburnbacteria bacterium RIFCSPLOWO2_01_FULL_41_27]|uniref:Uncharacterized protein n=2 Tax=Candidatus Blackburniibacteriota TaxID=1817898 RepID=A0A1G1VAE1_9BACT|nr:MAG: hypothetical protein A3F61_02480 [Candidatus Blackburnbacteria bacterium RIFCSPHIGHO2_12_FULL_41_13b]OGY14449.1 MAG: hypothetical protein A3A58_00045 [Candidatus Blackburnbacteria bacterium RIFCSPLOWO2_01_FULL_41_27]
MNSPERLYQAVSNSFDASIHQDGAELLPRERHLLFAMRCNGYFLTKDTQWVFDETAVKHLNNEFRGERVSLFGPHGNDSLLLTGANEDHRSFFSALAQSNVIEVIEKFRRVDEDLATKIAFILGGLVRYKDFKQPDSLYDSRVKYVARMSKLGEGFSGLNIAISMAMYLLSGVEITENERFKNDVSNMAEAIDNDPVEPLSTVDLGLSQTLRLKGFIDRLTKQPILRLPDVQPLLKFFDGFPTVGAEFHFSPDDPTLNHTFWQRLALLNMSQYQEGSFVQMSRNDRGVIEVRMNPSVYPVTIANWRRMMFLLPELKRAFFTVTFNRPNGDFYWRNEDDKNILAKLKSIGLLCYASLFEESPQRGRKNEIPFGTVYLGQTVRSIDGEFRFTGHWGGANPWNESGEFGQLGIYAGYGDSFPYMAYYPSMALAHPEILSDFNKNFWRKTQTLSQVLAFSPEHRKDVFSAIENNIGNINQLIRARRVGLEIIDLLCK